MEWPFIVEATVLPDVPPNLYVEPIDIAAGDEILFYRTLPNYPANAGWSLTYYLRGGGPGSANAGFSDSFVSTAFGSDHQMTVVSTKTAAWLPGRYQVQGFATNQTSGPNGVPERHIIYDGLWTIKPNFQTISPDQDTRTHARRVLDMIEATIEGKAGDDVLDSQIGGTTIRRFTPEQILKFHSYYKARVSAEVATAKIKGGRATGRTILARFSRPV